jgi:hypothetical protein
MKTHTAESAGSLCRFLMALGFIGAALLPAKTKAAVIVNYAFSDSAAGGFGYEAQSFTIPSGSSFDNLTFSWLAYGSGAPMAAGDLFLLSQPYFGSPSNLSAETPGFLDHTATVSQGTYVFTPTVQLAAGSMYWVYMGDDAAIAGTGFDTRGRYAGGQPYESFGNGASTADYHFTDTSVDYAFRLQGSAVPEPSVLTLSFLGVLGTLCVGRFPQRRRGMAPDSLLVGPALQG